MTTYIISEIKNGKQRFIDSFEFGTGSELYIMHTSRSARKAKRFHEEEASRAIDLLHMVSQVFPLEGQYNLLEA